MTAPAPLSITVSVTPDGQLAIQANAPNPIAAMDLLAAGMRAILADMAKVPAPEEKRVIAAPAGALRVLRPGS